MSLPDDIYGIASGVRAAADIHFEAKRQSGRTTRLVEQVRPGDTVIFLNQKAVAFFQRRMKAAGRCMDDLDVQTLNPSHLYTFLEGWRGEARILFDHDWLEEFYRQRITDTRELFAVLQHCGPEIKKTMKAERTEKLVRQGMIPRSAGLTKDDFKGLGVSLVMRGNE